MFRSLVLSFCLCLVAAAAVPASTPASARPVAVTIAYRASYFDTERAAQRHCPRDTVVWLNIPTSIYHYGGERWYGRTRDGAYVCEREAIAEGDRASRNGQ